MGPCARARAARAESEYCVHFNDANITAIRITGTRNRKPAHTGILNCSALPALACVSCALWLLTLRGEEQVLVSRLSNLILPARDIGFYAHTPPAETRDPGAERSS